MALRRLLGRARFPDAFRRAPMVAQFSSLGSVSAAWLTEEFRASMAAGLTPTGAALEGGRRWGLCAAVALGLFGGPLPVFLARRAVGFRQLAFWMCLRLSWVFF